MRNPYVGLQHTVFDAGYRRCAKDMHDWIESIMKVTPDVDEDPNIIVRGVYKVVMEKLRGMPDED